MKNELPLIRKGDRIFFKPEWQDKGDSEKTFVAMEDQHNNNVAVVCLLGMVINPWHYARLDMIERVEKI